MTTSEPSSPEKQKKSMQQKIDEFNKKVEVFEQKGEAIAALTEKKVMESVSKLSLGFNKFKQSLGESNGIISRLNAARVERGDLWREKARREADGVVPCCQTTQKA